jgi:hypothetical protein
MNTTIIATGIITGIGTGTTGTTGATAATAVIGTTATIVVSSPDSSFIIHNFF